MKNFKNVAVYTVLFLAACLIEATAFFGGDKPLYWQVIGGDGLSKPQLFSKDIDNVREEHIRDWWMGVVDDEEFTTLAEEENITAVVYTFKKSDGLSRTAIRYMDDRRFSQDEPTLHSSWSDISLVFGDAKIATVAINKGNGLVTTYDYKKVERKETLFVGMLVSDEEQR